jgi:type IV secretion system protein TrbL
MRLRSLSIWYPIVLGALVFCWTPDALAGVLGYIKSDISGNSGSWMSHMETAASHLFFALAGLEFVWWGITRLAKGGEVGDVLVGVMMKVITLGFFYTFMTEAPQWVPDIVHSFMELGQQAGGTTATTPSQIFNLGVEDAGNIINSLSKLAPSFWKDVTDPGGAAASYTLSAIIIGLCALTMVLAFALIALQLLITTIEMYIVVGGGIVLTGMFGSRWTLPIAEKYIGYAVQVGIKLMVIYLIVGLGSEVSGQLMTAFYAQMKAGDTVTPFLNVGFGALIFGVIGYMAPGFAGSLMSGSPSMSMSNVMPAAAAVGGVAAAPFMAAGGAALGAAAMVANKTLKAASGSGNAISGGTGGLSGLAAGVGGGSGVGSALKGLGGQATGAGMKAAGAGMQAAGKGISAAAGAAGAGIRGASAAANAIPVAGQAIAAAGQAAGAGVEMAGKAAGKGMNMAGQGMQKAGQMTRKGGEITQKAADNALKQSGGTGQRSGSRTAGSAGSSVPAGQNTASPKGTTDSLGGGQSVPSSGSGTQKIGGDRQKQPGDSLLRAGKTLGKKAGNALDPRRMPGDGHHGGGISIRLRHHEE